jgi:MbtH protein
LNGALAASAPVVSESRAFLPLFHSVQLKPHDRPIFSGSQVLEEPDMGSATSGNDATHQIITNDDLQFVVWSNRRPLPAGWRYVGKSGPRTELQAYLREMLVETIPAPLIISDRRAPDSRWG